MPELPEVETIKSALADAVCGLDIVEAYVYNYQLRKKIPTDFIDKIKNSKILSCRRKAKYLLLDLDNNITIVWHLGMSGRIIISKQKPETKKHDHVIIQTSNNWLVYNDARRFGLLTYCLSSEIDDFFVFKNTGIDPFDEKLNGLFLFNKIKNKKVPIKNILLDQSIINGIGNIYASEILFEAGVSPLRNANDVTEKECEKIVEKTRHILSKAIKAGGSTLKDYHKPDGSLGYFQNLHCVYNKTGQRCKGCTCNIDKTGGIVKIVQSGRSSFYCPVKQK